MKRFLILGFIFFLGFVSSYSNCIGELCCDDSDYVICDPSNPFVCGKDSEWCDNYNNPSLSCIPGEDWCCYNSGYVADYSAHQCCPPDSPFYITSGIYVGYCGVYNTGGANNYYTNLEECDYLYNWDTEQFTIEDECLGYDFKVCERNGISNWINGWDNKGKILNSCGVNCLTDANCPADEKISETCSGTDLIFNIKESICLNYNCEPNTIQENKGKILNECGVECLETSDCPEDEKVNDFCKDNILQTNYITNSCENNKCIKETKVIMSEKEIGVCEIECLTDSNCPEDDYIEDKFCKDDNVIQVFRDYFCESSEQSIDELYKCSFTEEEIILEECDYKCENNVCIEKPEVEDEEVEDDEEISEQSKIKLFFESIINWFKNIF